MELWPYIYLISRSRDRRARRPGLAIRRGLSLPPLLFCSQILQYDYKRQFLGVKAASSQNLTGKITTFGAYNIMYISFMASFLYFVSNTAVGRSYVYNPTQSHECCDKRSGVLQAGVLFISFFFIFRFLFIIIFIYFGYNPIFNNIAIWQSGLYGGKWSLGLPGNLDQQFERHGARNPRNSSLIAHI